MSPGQGSLPSDSIKVVPGRSKLRVESSNPVPRGNPIAKTSKVKLISPEEAIQLKSGCNQMAVSPRPVLARATSESPRPVLARATLEAPRSVPARPTPEAPRSVLARPTPGAPRPVLARPTPEEPRPVLARPTSEAPRTVPACPTSEAPRHVPPHPTSEVPRPKPARPTSEAPRPVPATTTARFRKEIVCGLRALSMYTQTVRQRTNPSLLQSKMVEPPSPRALQIRSRVKQQAANATQAVESDYLWLLLFSF